MILKDFLIENNITQKELANRMGYSKAAVSKIVNRILNPSFEKACLICELTENKVSLSELKKITPHNPQEDL